MSKHNNPYQKTGAFYVGMEIGDYVLQQWQGATENAEQWLANNTKTGQTVSMNIALDRQGAIRYFADKNQDNLHVNQVIGSWQLQKQIGVGVSADIWQAKHSRSGKIAALKIFNSSNQEYFEKFKREIQIIQRAYDIPQVVDILDSDVTAQLSPDHFSWFAMPVLQKTFYMNRLAIAPAKLPALISELINALQALQARDIFYFETKTDHLLLNAAQRLVLIDFGTALDFQAITDEAMKKHELAHYCQQKANDIMTLLGYCHSDEVRKQVQPTQDIEDLATLNKFFQQVKCCAII